MKYIDFHCDTASEILYQNKMLKKNDLSIDLLKLKKGEVSGEFFAFFIDAGINDNLYLEFEVMYRNFIREVEKNKDEIEIVTNLQELDKANSQGKVGAFLAIEEGDVLQGNINNIKKVYDLGIRYITLTWNYKNKLGYPNYNNLYIDKGLNPLGKEMVRVMQDTGVMVDASHLSDAGFYDLIDICKKPFIVSHSNSRAITNHPRNLTDDMIKALGNKGGIMGLNFCDKFLGTRRVAQINDMIMHIKHIINVGGIDILALGTDYDGILNKVEIENPTEMYKLEYRLKNEGFTNNEIEKIFYKNARRIIGELL